VIDTRRRSESPPAPTAAGRSVGVTVEDEMSKRPCLSQHRGRHFGPVSTVLSPCCANLLRFESDFAYAILSITANF